MTSALTLQHLVKSYAQGATRIPVLQDLSLTVPRGTSLAIIGQSGSGKSTLLSLIAGLDKPDAGQVTLHGVDINTLREDDLTRWRAEKIGIVFQQFHLLSNLNALENIALPLEIREQADAVTQARHYLELVGLGHRAQHFPHQLSGGECQRVAIARALIVRPEILLADEPSGNLDVETGAKVMDILFQLVAQTRTTLLLVTHNNELAARCKERWLLQHGTLIRQ